MTTQVRIPKEGRLFGFVCVPLLFEPQPISINEIESIAVRFDDPIAKYSFYSDVHVWPQAWRTTTPQSTPGTSGDQR